MKYFFTIILLFTATYFFGQDFKKINYQLSFGTTVTIPYKKSIEIWPEVDGHPRTEYGSNFGYFSEFLIFYNINKKISINSGLNYNYSRLKINDKIGFVESKGNITSSYIQIPVLISYHLSDKLPISISSGPYLGLLISAKEKGTSYIDNTIIGSGDPAMYLLEPVYEYDNIIRKDYSSIDVGLSMQINYEIRIGENLTGVILTRFNYGLVDVMTNEIVNKNTASEWKNYNLMIGLGIRLK
jgi:hypothetical protein